MTYLSATVSPLELYQAASRGQLPPEALERLRQLSEAYPYFTLPHLAVAASAARANAQASEVARAAIYAHDRGRLAAYLSGERVVSTTKPTAPEAKAPELEPAEVKPKETTPVEAKAEENKASEAKPVEVKPVELKAPEAKAVEPPAPKVEQKPEEVKPAAPADDRPQPRYVVKESKPRTTSNVTITRATGETAATPTPAATPAVPTSAEEPTAVPVATTPVLPPAAPSPAPAGASAVGQVDMKLQTVLNVRVGMYVPLVAQLASEVAAFKAEQASVIAAAPVTEATPTAAEVKLPEVAAVPAAPVAEKPAVAEAKPVVPEPKPEPKAERTSAKPAASLAPPAQKPDDLDAKIQAMIAGRVADLDPTAAPPSKAAKIEEGEARSQRPDPNDKLKAPWERRTPREEGSSVRPQGTLMNEPVETGMDQLRQSLLSMIQTQISEAPAEPTAPATPAAATPAPRPAPTAAPPPTPPPAAPELSPAESLAQLQAKIQEQVKASDARPAEAQPEPAPVSKPVLSPAQALRVEAKAQAPAPAAKATQAKASEAKSETQLRGSSESMRRFVSPDFGPDLSAGVRTGAPKPVAVDPATQAPAVQAVPTPAPEATPTAAAPTSPAADTSLHGSSESFKRFVSPDFNAARQSEQRADTTGSERPAALPIKDPAASVASAAAAAPSADAKAKPQEPLQNSMQRFVAPDFDMKPATLHLERPNRPAPPLAGEVPSAPQAAPAASGDSSESFKRFVAPDFSPAPAPAARAAEPAPETPAPAAPTAPATGDSSASFKRFVAPDFGAAPEMTPVAAPQAATPPAAPTSPPAVEAPVGEAENSMRRFVSPDFGVQELADRLEGTHGPSGAAPVAPAAELSTPTEAAAQRSAPSAQPMPSPLTKATSEATLGALERAFQKAQDQAPRTEVSRTPSVAEALAAIPTQTGDQADQLGQVIADVSDQAGTNVTDFAERIESFRQNLAKLRARGMPSPTDINLRTIQQKFLDRIVGAPRIGEGGRQGGATPAAPKPDEAKPDDAEAERAAAPAGARSVSALVERFEAFAPKIAESMSALRAQGRPTDPVESAEAEAPEAATGSETLARILLQQGQRDRAVQMLEQLALNMPEKSAYFAALIAEWRARPGA